VDTFPQIFEQLFRHPWGGEAISVGIKVGRLDRTGSINESGTGTMAVASVTGKAWLQAISNDCRFDEMYAFDVSFTKATNSAATFCVSSRHFPTRSESFHKSLFAVDYF